MPGGDRTGPMGAGPRTGRAAGFCAGYDVPGTMNPYGWYGGGFGWGRGRGWGSRRAFGRGMAWRHGGGFAPGWGVPYGMPPPYAFVTPSPEDELGMLREQNKQLEEALKNIKKRISQLEKEGD